MSTSRACCVAFVALLGTACLDRTLISPHANAILVQSVLDASVTDQYVVVQTTTGAISQQKAVTGAIVTIFTPDGRGLIAEELHDSTLVAISSSEPRVTSVYHISLSRYGVSLIAGGTYQLKITLPDGRQVSGSTTIPQVALAVASGGIDSLDRTRDSLTLAWPRVAGASGYEVTVSSTRATYTFFADTAISLPGTTRSSSSGFVFYPGLMHRVAVSAVDRNYYDFFRKDSDFFTGEGLIVHLDGATGVFGSLVPIETRTVFVR